jgi:hypothetical protein
MQENTSGAAAPALTRPLHTDAETGSDPDLARLVTAWPALPPHIKAAVLALVVTGR